MKAVILAGGFGSRISEESTVRPKPMVEIGGKPILWHIMKTYSYHGIHDFIVACGYKGNLIKEYFSQLVMAESDVTFDLCENRVEFHNARVEPWRVTCVDTGAASMTGGRLRHVRDYLDGETFCMTYGDGVSDINVSEEVEFHKQHGKLATLAAVNPPGRFGVFNLEPGATLVSDFEEKPEDDMTWVNGGFFVLEPEVLDYIENDMTVWEDGPMRQLSADQQLAAFRHSGYWQPMDTLRDKNVLEELWVSGESPWAVWRKQG